MVGLCFLCSLCTSSAFSLIAFEIAFCPLFFIHHLILLSTIPTQHHVCIFLIETGTFTSSFHHQVSPLILLHLFFPHTSSHAFKTPSLKCPHKFCAPTSTDFITFSSNHFPIFTSFSKLIFLLSVHVFLTTFLIFFLSISATINAC